MQNATKAYLSTQVTTTTQADLLILLYDGAIKFLAQAREAIERRDVKAKGELLGKASDIVNELMSSLNKEKGGEIAENLARLYFYCNSRLLTANLKMDVEAIDQVVNILRGLRSAYDEIRDIVPTSQTPVQPSLNQTARPLNLGAAASAAAAAMRSRQAGAYQSTAPRPVQPPIQLRPQPQTPADASVAPHPEQPVPPVTPAATRAPAQTAPQPAPQPTPQEAPRPGSLYLKRANAAYGNISGK